jgi:hypothetical protein
MKYDNTEKVIKRVPGTNRFEWRTPTGEVMQYRNVHLKPFCWELLADLARAQGISASMVIERLVTSAAGYEQSRSRQY